MAQMKKYELLKKAYDDYPKGTQYKTKGDGPIFTSSGRFDFNDEGVLGDAGTSIAIYTEDSGWVEIVSEVPCLIDLSKHAVCVYNEDQFRAVEDWRKQNNSKPGNSPHGMEYPFYVSLGKKYGHTTASADGKCYLKDYTLIEYSAFQAKYILKDDEKIGVRIENEEQYKAMMTVFASKGWKNAGRGEAIPSDVSHYHSAQHAGYNVWACRDGYGYLAQKEVYVVMSFDDFCYRYSVDNKPVPLIIGEDGVSLYSGSLYFRVELVNNMWIYMSQGRTDLLGSSDNCIMKPHENKAFSSEQAALKWLRETCQMRFDDQNIQPIYEVKDNKAIFQLKDGASFFMTGEELELLIDVISEK